jgi:hypothetical protein
VKVGFGTGGGMMVVWVTIGAILFDNFDNF